MSSVFAVYRSRLLGTVWTAWLPGVKASYQDVILLDSGFLTINRTNLIKAYDKGLSALPRYMSYIPCD